MVVRRLYNQKGVTLIEALISLALITVVVMSVTNSLRMADQFFSKAKLKRDRDQIVSSTLQGVLQNISLYQKNYQLTDQAREALLAESKLPFAWSENVFTTVDQCPTCPGRVGYIIEPLPNMGGLNQVTVRITNKNLFQGFQQYVFILSDD